MLYKALGLVVWKLAMRQLRQMIAGYRRPAAALTVAAAAAIYVATRGDDE